jgi:N-acylneuraminate cytidylyltransferase
MTILNKKILAIIPARGGSKGILKKNIHLLAGKPLLAWTIEAAKGSKFIDRIVVSSDDNDILNVASQFGAQPIKRSKAIAGDKSPFNLLIFHVLDYLKKKEKYVPDILIYLQPTSPLRESKDINKALSLFKSNTECIISVSEGDNKVLKSFITDTKGFLKGIFNDKFPFMNRQELPSVYDPNGAIYIIKREIFQKTEKLFSGKAVPFLMSSEKSLDVDSLGDLKIAEKILKKTHKTRNKSKKKQL